MKKVLIGFLLMFSVSSFAGCFEQFSNLKNDMTNLLNSHDFSQCSSEEVDFAKHELNDFIIKRQKKFKAIRRIGINRYPDEQFRLTTEITAAKTSLILLRNLL